jgi:membrane protein involved in colicin uptake
MRAAFGLSFLLHVSIIVAALVSLPEPETMSTPSVNALPVELVTIAEETDLTVGRPEESEVVEDPAPRTVEAEAPPEPETAPGATDEPAERIATEEEAVDSPEVASAPEPSAREEPEPVEPEEPDTPQETEVAALPEAETAEAPAEPAETETPPPPATVVPRARPTPPPRRERARVEREAPEEFDADNISQLINRNAPTGGGEGAAVASLGTEAGRLEAALTLSEQDSLRAQMQRCWSPPVGVLGSDELVITVRIRLAPDGTVDTIEQIGAEGLGALYDVAADAARRAVLQCQPYRLPPNKYEAWKEVQVNFDPRELF